VEIAGEDAGMTTDTAPSADRLLVAVFASPVADVLLRWGPELGFRTVLVEPDPTRVPSVTATDVAVGTFAELADELAGGSADVVVTDHHRDELGEVLRDALTRPARWIGVMGNPRHEGPHVAALTALGVPATDIARVHRPIGLDIGSRAPAEIAVSTLAGLLADRNGRSGGFAHGG
jgi:xanthine dehydrogenase accessory factor